MSQCQHYTRTITTLAVTTAVLYGLYIRARKNYLHYTP